MVFIRGFLKSTPVSIVSIFLFAVFVQFILPACGGDSAPDSGQACTSDFQCAQGEYCKEGVCTTVGGDKDPQVCSDDNDCGDSKICEAGLCVDGVRQDGGLDGGEQTTDGDSGEDASDQMPDETSNPQPDISLGGDVIVRQDAQGLTYELNFGNVTMGVAVSQNLTIKNNGDAPLVLSVVTLADDPDEEFGLKPQVPPELTIDPGDEHILVVEYNAADGLTDMATARIFSNDPDSGQLDVNLISEFKGEAAVAVDPVSLDFGDVSLDTAKMLPVTISNQGTGNAVLRVDEVTPEPALASAFSAVLFDATGGQITAMPAYINRGDFLTAEVTFDSQFRNEFEGNLVIVHSQQDSSPATVSLKGRAGIPSIDVQPHTIDFGQVPVDDWATDIEVLVSNVGVGDLTIFSVSLTPADPFVLDAIAATPFTVSADSQQSFLVRYSPSQLGSDSALLSIEHDDPSVASVQIPLAGQGVEGNAIPTALIKANGSDQDLITVNRGDRVNLDGRSSFDNDGSIVEYQWTLNSQPLPDNCSNPESSLSSTTSPSPFILVKRGGVYSLSLKVKDNDGDWSLDDELTIQALSAPQAVIRQGGNDTGFVLTDMGNTLQFNGGYSSDCDGTITAYEWIWVTYPLGRGAPPSIGGGQQYASVLFDYPGNYTIGLKVTDDDSPANISEISTFDIRVKGPKAFRITADWYNLGLDDNRVDVDIHLLKPGALSDWEPDACCPKDGPEGDNCDSNPDWGILGSPVYQTDGWEDDGVVPQGAAGDEINFANPGMGQYTIKIQFRCLSSTLWIGNYICCNDNPTCGRFFCSEVTRERKAEGVVTIYVTDYENNETQLVRRPFFIDAEQICDMETIGILSWPDGSFQ